MLFKLLSTLIYLYKKLTTPSDYSIISEEIEYTIDHDTKYKIEDDFWEHESKDWDGILDEYHCYVTNKRFRNTIIPQNVNNFILRVKYYYGGRVYKAITQDINFIPGKYEQDNMIFSIPLRHVWIVDHDDKPQLDITEKVKRYAGPRNNFHDQDVPLQDFLYYTQKTLETRFPKIMLTNSLGMKKIVLTTEDRTTDLRIP
tara:strand:- start:928 stop:1527 length:600 start_codon:yes stop_codon:yes gene_type:complete